MWKPAGTTEYVQGQSRLSPVSRKKNKIIKQKCKKHLIVVKVVKQSLYFIIDLGSEKVKSLRAKGS